MFEHRVAPIISEIFHGEEFIQSTFSPAIMSWSTTEENDLDNTVLTKDVLDEDGTPYSDSCGRVMLSCNIDDYHENISENYQRYLTLYPQNSLKPVSLCMYFRIHLGGSASLLGGSAVFLATNIITIRSASHRLQIAVEAYDISNVTGLSSRLRVTNIKNSTNTDYTISPGTWYKLELYKSHNYFKACITPNSGSRVVLLEENDPDDFETGDMFKHIASSQIFSLSGTNLNSSSVDLVSSIRYDTLVYLPYLAIDYFENTSGDEWD